MRISTEQLTYLISNHLCNLILSLLFSSKPQYFHHGINLSFGEILGINQFKGKSISSSTE
ncbi:hypothetical protein VCHC43B1_0812 [Vibrio cholerae HC-43B1]|nr:hypothetical protein VCHC43B1_0812 [Vibrio cholerae HC-43B1]